jgi:alpha-tubulin suppressor-like RCC1 family protein
LAFCWGSDEFGQLGDGPDKIQHNIPSAVAGGHLFSQIDAGYHHVCAVTTEQRAYCWGYGPFGTIGDGKLFNRSTPRAVAGNLLVSRVTAGGVDTCAETIGNRTYCWGYNHEGQLGIGVATDTVIPRPQGVVGGLLFAQVSVGGLHVCARTKTGTTYCWGDNRFGQLGEGTTNDRYSPTKVGGGL